MQVRGFAWLQAACRCFCSGPNYSTQLWPNLSGGPADTDSDGDVQTVAAEGDRPTSCRGKFQALLGPRESRGSTERHVAPGRRLITEPEDGNATREQGQ